MDSERKESSKIMQFVVVELRTKAGLAVMLNFKRKVVILWWPCWLPPRCFFGFPLRCHGSRVAHDKQRRLINEDMTRQNAGRWHRRCSSSPGRRLVRRTVICFRANWLTLRGKFWSGKLTMRNIESGETVITFTSLSATMRCNRIDEKWAGRRENFFWNLIWREKRKKSGRWRGRRRRVWLTFSVLRELCKRESNKDDRCYQRGKIHQEKRLWTCKHASNNVCSLRKRFLCSLTFLEKEFPPCSSLTINSIHSGLFDGKMLDKAQQGSWGGKGKVFRFHLREKTPESLEQNIIKLLKELSFGAGGMGSLIAVNARWKSFSASRAVTLKALATSYDIHNELDAFRRCLSLLENSSRLFSPSQSRLLTGWVYDCGTFDALDEGTWTTSDHSLMRSSLKFVGVESLTRAKSSSRTVSKASTFHKL